MKHYESICSSGMTRTITPMYRNTKRCLGYFFRPPPLPQLEETWWGPRLPESVSPISQPFLIKIPENDLKDLQWRLENHRPFTPPLEGIQQQYGFNTRLLKDIVEFWKTKYDWKEREIFLNKFPQFKINIQGLDIHYIHVKPQNVKNVKVLPLLLLHGWPGSLREFYDILPMLTTPQDGRNFVFEVIAPHIPGYGFSQAAVKPGLGAAQIAQVFKNMMIRLGFTKYYTQGGDFGGIILQYMSALFPEHVLGFHTNLCYVYTPKSYLKTLLAAAFPFYTSWYVRPDHYRRVFPLMTLLSHRLQESGYAHLQATKPDTLGVAMNDSPVGLAAYILEKFLSRTKTEDGGLKEHFSYTDLLDNVMIYWLTKSATTSFRLYAETINKKEIGMIMQPVKVPTALARFHHDFYAADGILKELYPNLIHLADYQGGHFAAFQSPDVLAKDIFIAVDKFENSTKRNDDYNKNEY